MLGSLFPAFSTTGKARLPLVGDETTPVAYSSQILL
jgi:hypothetical protein